MKTKPTQRDEIGEVIKELHDAMLESLEASKVEDDAKLKKIKAQKRLLMAREAVHAISFNN